MVISFIPFSSIFYYSGIISWTYKNLCKHSFMSHWVERYLELENSLQDGTSQYSAVEILTEWINIFINPYSRQKRRYWNTNPSEIESWRIYKWVEVLIAFSQLAFSLTKSISSSILKTIKRMGQEILLYYTRNILICFERIFFILNPANIWILE